MNFGVNALEFIENIKGFLSTTFTEKGLVTFPSHFSSL